MCKIWIVSEEKEEVYVFIIHRQSSSRITENQFTFNNFVHGMELKNLNFYTVLDFTSAITNSAMRQQKQLYEKSLKIFIIFEYGQYLSELMWGLAESKVLEYNSN